MCFLDAHLIYFALSFHAYDKICSDTELAFDVDWATVCVDYFFTDTQTEAYSLFVCVCGFLDFTEVLEEFLLVLSGDPTACVSKSYGKRNLFEGEMIAFRENLFIRCIIVDWVERSQIFFLNIIDCIILLISDLNYIKMHWDSSISVCELDRIGKKVEYDLTIAPLVSKDLKEVQFVYFITEDRADQLHTFKGTLSGHRTLATFDQTDKIEIFIDQSECIVGHLGLIH